MNIDHIAVYCIDLENMKRFFVEHFACNSNELYHNPRTGLKTYILSFPDGGARLELMSRPEVIKPLADVFRGGLIHVSIALGTEANVDTKTDELKDAGYDCISDPRVTGDGYYESCIVGPEGILIEVTV